MRALLIICICTTSFLFLKNTDQQSASVAISTKDTLSPVETKKPNSEYKPAFSGQTRINSVKTTTPYKIEKIAEKIGKPWAITLLPDGRWIVTDKTGFMTLYAADGKSLKKITGFPVVDDGGQGGMLDVAPDPAFAQNKTIYWSFSEKQDDGNNLMAVAKGQISPDETTILKPTVIFRATPSLKSRAHYGSRILFDKSGNMFVSTGERSIPEGRKQAQLVSAGLGKIFHITKEGKPAPGNPFLKDKDAMPQIYAYGVRNPQGLAFHPVTGDLWEVEFGPRGGDELNIIKAGRNYGWPTITYGIEYSGAKIGEAIQQKAGMEQPIYYWDPVISPSGIVFYTGNAVPEWKNNLFVSGLGSTHIARLVIVNNKVVGEERIMEDKRERVRDVAYANNMLYAVTESGNMYRISKK
ncbi:MAG: PQQ-dependent sugar dehydrogenase [Chitinophagaceae bacterium]